MTIVLMVAEKPSIAEAIAKILAHGKTFNRRGGKTPVFEFPGNFQGRGVTFRVTSVIGHVFNTDFPSQYQNWDAVDPLTLFDAQVVKNEANSSVVRHLQSEAKKADYLVLWLDCDREGENICFEVINCVQSKMNRVPGQQIFRAKFSAVAPSDVDKAMRTLGAPNENESLSVDARQELDLKVGVAFSRFQTRFFQGKYGNLDSSMVSYGPCQTPTLGFCVDRHDEIQSFQPEKYWVVNVEIEKGGKRFTLDWGRGRVFDQEVTLVCNGNKT